MDLLAFSTFLLFTPLTVKFFNTENKFNLRETILKMLKDPLLISVIVTFLIKILNINVPEFISDIALYIGGSFFFLITLMVGITFKFPNLKNIYRVLSVYLFRLVAAVLLVLLVTKIIGSTKDVIVSALLLYLAQVSVMSPVIAKENKFDHELVSQLALFSIALQLILYPFAIFIIKQWIL